ncbi:hypothetical protein QE152_g22577 [Popillia japonica]|uniref:Uncharacterized protein n=1 Tax=Popillia japonica TaxID=7064 RepID=A0AAW1KKC6_POPJA
MSITIKKGSSIILQDKSKIVEGGEINGGFINFLIPILAAAAGPVLANILNKVVDTIDDKRHGLSDESRIKGTSLTLELPNQPPIPLKKTLSQKDKDAIEKNIRTLMNITNKEDSDCDDDIPLLCFGKSNQVENINPTEEIKKLLTLPDKSYSSY